MTQLAQVLALPELRRHVAIVGAAGDKFTADTEAEARKVIRGILRPGDVLVSGGCHLGGVDIWAEEEADAMGLDKNIHLPETLRWSTGYRPRNMRIVRDCTEAHCIAAAAYPPDYAAVRYGELNGRVHCYHCPHAPVAHVKSGGCWTLKCAMRFGKPVRWHVVSTDGCESFR